jgi:DNA segregation ATPase FtsK/SpoIIIE-like protein
MNNPHHKSRFQLAKDMAKERGYLSAGILQREFNVSLYDALRLIELLQERGVIGIRDHTSTCAYLGSVS